MGDFYLDFRAPDRRGTTAIAEAMRFRPHIRPVSIGRPDFDLVVNVTEDPEIWAPYARPDGRRIVALAGRVAFEESDWSLGSGAPGDGGLACKVLDALVERSGLGALERVSGNFALVVVEPAASRVVLITDCTGVFPAFESEADGRPVFASHADLLARACKNSDDLDGCSLAEFLLTGTVSAPFTYYRKIRSVGRAAWIAVTTSATEAPSVERRSHSPLRFRGKADDNEDDLAEEFAAAFARSVRLRSHPRLGRCAVALSGGLDSRAVLASLDPEADALAFTCFDARNTEFRAASAIAEAAGIRFLPFQRSFDYYAENARAGIRINGGMGSFANNHFLGTLPWLRENGVRTLLTGCYCDYLFKGLPLNRRTHPVTGLEELGSFDPEFYFTHVWPETPAATEARERLAARYARLDTNDRSDAAVFELEVARTFPLAYEGDNAQRLVPQHITGWMVPVSDPGLMDLYCRIPYRFKLNRSLFSKAVRRMTGSRYRTIPDANTGARVGAPWWTVAASSAWLRIRNRLLRFRGGHATQGSWPNWLAYGSRSPALAELWNQPSQLVEDLVARVLGPDRRLPELGKGTERQMWLQIQILTLKLWELEFRSPSR
ncbi:MAG: hypothetical protein JNL97_15605 [Verrucomicrobiales bacterium]|nr:hypothetical protein [Verrucomicrobiales bacterium]